MKLFVASICTIVALAAFIFITALSISYVFDVSYPDVVQSGPMLLISLVVYTPLSVAVGVEIHDKMELTS